MLIKLSKEIEKNFDLEASSIAQDPEGGGWTVQMLDVDGGGIGIYSRPDGKFDAFDMNSNKTFKMRNIADFKRVFDKIYKG